MLLLQQLDKRYFRDSSSFAGNRRLKCLTSDLASMHTQLRIPVVCMRDAESPIQGVRKLVEVGEAAEAEAAAKEAVNGRLGHTHHASYD